LFVSREDTPDVRQQMTEDRRQNRPPAGTSYDVRSFSWTQRPNTSDFRHLSSVI
jgi:hypothetical protein